MAGASQLLLRRRLLLRRALARASKGLGTDRSAAGCPQALAGSFGGSVRTEAAGGQGPGETKC